MNIFEKKLHARMKRQLDSQDVQEIEGIQSWIKAGPHERKR